MNKTLTNRELQVLRLVALTDDDISHILRISKYTVQEHIRRIFRKLGVERRTQAIIKVTRLGLLKPDNFPISYERSMYD